MKFIGRSIQALGQDGPQLLAHLGRVGHAVRGHGRALAHFHGRAAQALHRVEAGLVGHIVADEDRCAPHERRLTQKCLDRVPLAHATGLGLQHHLAAQQGQARRCVHRRPRGGQADGRQCGRLPIVQCDRAALEFDPQARVLSCQRLRRRVDPRRRGNVRQDQVAVRASPLGTVHPRHRQTRRREQGVDLLDGPAADHGDRSTQVGLQGPQRGNQLDRYDHRLRSRGDVHQRAVKVQEERTVSFEIGGKIHRGSPYQATGKVSEVADAGRCRRPPTAQPRRHRLACCGFVTRHAGGKSKLISKG
jgi:hypothetical protein